MRRVQFALLSSLIVLFVAVGGGQTPGADRLTADLFESLELRSIGPALTTGRVADFDVDPKNPSVYYVASARPVSA